MSEPRPHILYVITDLERGGVPLHLYRLATAMGRRGFRTTVVSLAPVGPVGRMLREGGVIVHSCQGLGGWDLRVLPRLRRLVKSIRPDVIHALLFHANVAARYAAREAGFPRQRLVCEIQTVEVERRWHLLVDRWTHRHCRTTVGNSPSVIDHLASRARIPRDRLRLIRGGIDPRPIQDAAPADTSTLGLQPAAGLAAGGELRSLQWPDIGCPIVLWAGRLDPVKGLLVLINAFGDVASQTSAHLLLAGDGPLRLKLAKQIARLNLGARVHLLGPRTDVPGLLKIATVFVFPSRTEGLPNALLEAMAAGCPIIATDVPGCRDLITHDRTGLLVPYGDTSRLADGIRHLIRDTVMAKRLAEDASQVVNRDWHLDSTHRSYAALYEEIQADI